MGIILIRSLLLYLLVISAVRLMGKRQLGELQPSELVITILVSNIATLPVEDTDIPLLIGITPILSLVCFEVLMSWLDLRIPRMRKMICGSPKIVIRDGKIDIHTLSELRFSVDDLLMALRGKDIFDVSEVQFAIVETTGSVSVLKKAEKENVTRSDMGIKPENADPPQLVISDGRTIRSAMDAIGMSRAELSRILEKAGLKQEEVFMLTADRSRKCFAADRKGNSYDIAGKGNRIDKS